MGSASVAIALDEANRADAPRAGHLTLPAGFGGRTSIGACLLRWGHTV